MSLPTQTLRQPVVVVLGHVDSGKCVSGETLIQLADGRILEASRVFEAHKTGEPTRKPDGEVYEARDLEVLSVAPDGRVVPREGVTRLEAQGRSARQRFYESRLFGEMYP